jgi:hypothetical protein
VGDLVQEVEMRLWRVWLLGAIALSLVPLAGAASPASSRDGLRPAEPPELRALQAVSIDSATDGWAVGDHWQGLGHRMKHWDGTHWKQVRDGAPGITDPRAVDAVSPTDAWVVGDYSEIFTFAEHWDGTSWTERLPQDPGGSEPEDILWGVGEVSPTDVWAVGSAISDEDEHGSTLIEHWDGSDWSIVPSPDPVGLERPYLACVSVVSTDDVWAVGGSRYTEQSIPLVEHWNGKRWSIIKSPNPGGVASLYSVTALSAHNVWAVGSRGNDNQQTLIEHWDGGGWSVVASPDGDGRVSLLQSVDAVSGQDVWAVGHSGASDGRGDTLVEHWDGSTWGIVPSPNPGSARNGLTSVSADSHSDAWAVGYTSDTTLGKPLMEHWDGDSWTSGRGD